MVDMNHPSTKHDYSGHPVYHLCVQIKQRTTCSSFADYHRYGGTTMTSDKNKKADSLVEACENLQNAVQPIIEYINFKITSVLDKLEKFFRNNNDK